MPRRQTVPGLDGQKMSKSYGNTIDIFAEEKEMRKRVMSIVTDSTPVEAPKDPDCVLDFPAFLARRHAGGSGGDAARLSRKAGLATVISRSSFSRDSGSFSRRCAQRREEILAQTGYIDEVLTRRRGARECDRE